MLFSKINLLTFRSCIIGKYVIKSKRIYNIITLFYIIILSFRMICNNNLDKVIITSVYTEKKNKNNIEKRIYL